MKGVKIKKGRFGDSYILNYHAGDARIAKEIIAGNYEPYESEQLQTFSQEGMNILDIGANIGYYSLLLSKKVGRKGRIYAFEPDPVSYGLLRRNLEENSITNVEVFNVAVSSVDEERHLYVSDENYGDHRVYEAEETRDSHKVKCVSLDSWSMRRRERVDLVKMDTQGFETYIVEGARNLIKQYRPILFFEFWPYGYKLSGGDYHAMLRFLEDNEYSISLIDEPRFRLIPIDCQYLENHKELSTSKVHCNLIAQAPRLPAGKIVRLLEYFDFGRKKT